MRCFRISYPIVSERLQCTTHSRLYRGIRHYETKKERERVGGREIERERERERQTDRQKEKQTDRQRDRQTDSTERKRGSKKGPVSAEALGLGVVSAEISKFEHKSLPKKKSTIF